MKTGKISTLTVAVALCFVAMLSIRISLIPNASDQHNTLKPLPTLSQVTRLPDFESYGNIREKKAAFFDFLRPIVQKINDQTMKKREKLTKMLSKLNNGEPLTATERQKLAAWGSEYGLMAVESKLLAERLLKRIDIVPEPLVLVQAANESGWGSSRFAKEGLNLFGQWCFSKGCGIVPSARAEDMDHEVTVYYTVEEAITAYINNLNSHAAYQLFRAIRAEQRSRGDEPKADELVYGLINYSERREAYVDELLQMLKHNKEYLEPHEANQQTASAV